MRGRISHIKETDRSTKQEVGLVWRTVGWLTFAAAKLGAPDGRPCAQELEQRHGRVDAGRLVPHAVHGQHHPAPCHHRRTLLLPRRPHLHPIRTGAGFSLCATFFGVVLSVHGKWGLSSALRACLAGPYPVDPYWANTAPVCEIFSQIFVVKSTCIFEKRRMRKKFLLDHLFIYIYTFIKHDHT